MPQTIKVVHVPCDPHRPVTVKEVGQGDLRGYQALVGGGHIEVVPVGDNGDAAVFDANGLDVLPVNRRATRYMAARGMDNAAMGYYCGDAAFFSCPVGTQEFQSATDTMITAWMDTDWLAADTSAPSAGRQAAQ